MTKTTKALIAVCTLLLIILSVGAYQYVQQVKEMAGAEAHGKAQDAIIAAKDQTIAERQARIDERDKAWDEREKQFAKERAKVTDVHSATQAITAVVPGAHVIEVPHGQLPPQVTQQLPDAPSYACMPKDTAVALGQMAVDFKRLNEQATKLTADNADLRQQLKDAQDAKAAAESKAARWEQAARGGTVAHRATTAGKWAAVGAAVGVITYRVVKGK